jgi:hypothetical protein
VGGALHPGQPGAVHPQGGRAAGRPVQHARGTRNSTAVHGITDRRRRTACRRQG